MRYQVDILDGWNRIQDAPNNKAIAVQGNLDPMVLHGPKELIKARTEDILQKMNSVRTPLAPRVKETGPDTVQQTLMRGHVMNLGHGIDELTPEENVKYFVDLVHNWRPS
jgi:uroporphyrinogen decarboxylase